MLPRNTLELLAPARDKECAMAAITHGADVVYMGAPAFGARKQAANSIDDIAQVVRAAHIYGVRIYVALNTLLFDNEVVEAVRIANELYKAGVDALIVQDMALVENTDMPPIALHASTQLSNHTADKVLFWQRLGMEQVVLDRELTRDEIRAIAEQTDVRLECFVHGALCVSYSGRCFMSQVQCGRSANRGDCAQLCRLPYTVRDAAGHTLAKDKYVLSLRDLNRSDQLEEMIDAGVSAFKIEGRLKSADYVANVTLNYRQRLDEIIARRKDLRRASAGRVLPGFEPDLAKSFNRGFTSYFFHGRQPAIWQPDTPKSLGEYVGRATNVSRGSFDIKSDRELSYGDGLFFIVDDKSDGLKANRVEKVGGGVQRVFPLRMNGITDGARVYRNMSVAFAAQMKNDTTKRVIDIEIQVEATADGLFSVSIVDEEGIESCTRKKLTTNPATNPDSTRSLIAKQFSKLGGTPYEASHIDVSPEAAAHFATAAELNALRREAVETHTHSRIEAHRPTDTRTTPTDTPYIVDELKREGNVLNDKAKAFYLRHGTRVTEWGYERQLPQHGTKVMTTRHCLLNSLGLCLKQNPKSKQLLPLTLEHGKDVYTATPDCRACEMTIIKL